MSDILIQIDILLEKLESLPPLSQGTLERIYDDFRIEYTYNSNAIEGSTLTKQETYMLLKDGISIGGKPQAYQNDAIGHGKAFNYVLEQSASDKTIDENIILEIHKRVLMNKPEDAGQYRTVGVYIGGTDAVLPSPEAVPGRIKKLILEYPAIKEKMHLVDAVALFHLEFESIHPFIDGNGRTGRLLMNYELMQNGYPPIDIKVEDKQRYYYGFHAYQGNDEDEMPMLNYVRDYVQKALIERIRLAEQSKEVIKKRNGIDH